MIRINRIVFSENVKFPLEIRFHSLRDKTKARPTRAIKAIHSATIKSINSNVVIVHPDLSNYIINCDSCGRRFLYDDVVLCERGEKFCLDCFLRRYTVEYNQKLCKQCGNAIGVSFESMVIQRQLDVDEYNAPIEYRQQQFPIPPHALHILMSGRWRVVPDISNNINLNLSSNHDSSLCEECGVKCPKCSRIVRKNELLISGKACTMCTRLIKRNPYNYVPNKIVFNKHEMSCKHDNLFLGLELEVHTGRSYTPDIINHHIFSEIADIPKFFYSMYDGSIEPGIEFATMPFDEKCFCDKKYAPMRNIMVTLIEELKKHISIDGHNTHPACGIHIHINRKSLNTKIIYNLLNFIYNNKSFMKRISDRDFENTPVRGHESFSKFDAKRKIAKAIEKVNGDKYTIVNFVPLHTIEIRCFKSVLDIDIISKNIEFVFALVNWCREVSHRESRHLENFVTYTEENYRRYPNLFKFLVTNKYSEKQIKPANTTVEGVQACA